MREGKEVFFLKHLHHARQIRNRLLECFERASCPEREPEERKRLLSFIVVGGGPTSCEFVAELHDFIVQDVNAWYPDLAGDVTITLVEAGDGLLSSFEKSLATYVINSFKNRNIDVRLGTAVTEVIERPLATAASNARELYETVAILSDGRSLPFELHDMECELKLKRSLLKSCVRISKLRRRNRWPNHCQRLPARHYEG